MAETKKLSQARAVFQNAPNPRPLRSEHRAAQEISKTILLHELGQIDGHEVHPASEQSEAWSSKAKPFRQTGYIGFPVEELSQRLESAGVKFRAVHLSSS
jgi:hypothetical protein